MAKMICIAATLLTHPILAASLVLHSTPLRSYNISLLVTDGLNVYALFKGFLDGLIFGRLKEFFQSLIAHGKHLSL